MPDTELRSLLSSLRGDLGLLRETGVEGLPFAVDTGQRKNAPAAQESLPTTGEEPASVEAVSVAESMEEAVRAAAGAAQSGDIVLLAPACTSFDMFDNYEHRGRAFKAAVHALDGERAPAEKRPDAQS